MEAFSVAIVQFFSSLLSILQFSLQLSPPTDSDTSPSSQPCDPGNIRDCFCEDERITHHDVPLVDSCEHWLELVSDGVLEVWSLLNVFRPA